MELELKMTSPAKRIVPKCIKVHHSRVRPALSKNIVYCTYNYVVELFGSSLPLSVAESLHYTPGAKDCASANLNPEISWAWYVCGRRLLCWYTRIPSLTDSLMPVFAREMVLPLSDLANNANCVYIFPGPNQQSPSCIAVTPEGVVRYWSVLGTQRYVDLNANLGGEKVYEVKYLSPLGCLAVTTSGTMILITPVMVRNDPTVRIKKITGASGWLKSIGKTIGSLLFGLKSQRLALKTVRTLTSLKDDAQWHIFLLAGFTFQSWSIEIRNSISYLIFETNIEKIVRRAFPDLVRDDPKNEIQITDIKYSEAGSIIVLAASNKPRFYIIVELDGDYITPPTYAARLCTLNRSNVTFFEDKSGEISPLCFLLLPESALVFNKFILYGVPFSGGNEVEGELLELPGGFALGALMYQKTPIFFSARYGFVSITPANTSSIDILNTTHGRNLPETESMLRPTSICGSPLHGSFVESIFKGSILPISTATGFHLRIGDINHPSTAVIYHGIGSFYSFDEKRVFLKMEIELEDKLKLPSHKGELEFLLKSDSMKEYCILIRYNVFYLPKNKEIYIQEKFLFKNKMAAVLRFSILKNKKFESSLHTKIRLLLDYTSYLPPIIKPTPFLHRFDIF